MSYQLMAYHLINSSAGMESIEKHHRYLNRILPSWLELDSSGRLEVKQSPLSVEKLSLYFEKSSIIPLLQNKELDSKVSNRLVSEKEAQKKAIDHLLLYLQDYGFPGINLDLEGVKKQNESNFTAFIEDITTALHQHNFDLYLCVPAKWEHNDDSSWSGAYNYLALGELVDKIIIMAYDYHWPGGPPGAIAPLNWVQDVIDYAIINIPLEKIILGIGFYGYEWVINSEEPGRGLTYPQIKSLQLKYNTMIEWDQDSSSPYLRYQESQQEHEIWFENMVSIKEKIKLVKSYQLAGAAFWRLGQEDQRLWRRINEVIPL